MLAEPNNVEPAIINPIDLDKSHCESAKSLARKGNEGKHSTDPHFCCICQKVLSCRNAVKEHLERHHLKKNKMFCDLCPKILFTRDAVVKHMQSAHNRDKFACVICNFKTARKTYLKMHKLTHAAKTECPVCHKQVTSLESHQRMHVLKERCSICQKLVLPRNLKQHMKVHRIRKCRDCEETFESHEELRR